MSRSRRQDRPYARKGSSTPQPMGLKMSSWGKTALQSRPSNQVGWTTPRSAWGGALGGRNGGPSYFRTTWPGKQFCTGCRAIIRQLQPCHVHRYDDGLELGRMSLFSDAPSYKRLYVSVFPGHRCVSCVSVSLDGRIRMPQGNDDAFLSCKRRSMWLNFSSEAEGRDWAETIQGAIHDQQRQHTMKRHATAKPALRRSTRHHVTDRERELIRAQLTQIRRGSA